MIEANFNYITKEDIEDVLKLNPKEDDFESSFVTDGKYLYYVDGYTNSQEIRALNEEEQWLNLPELAKSMGKTTDKVIKFMLKENKLVDYENIPENNFRTKKEVDKWWSDKTDRFIFKVYDEYCGIAELIASL